MDILSTISQSVCIAGFFAGAFSYIVLKPLHQSIEGLRTIVQELKDELRYSESRRHELQERVAKIEVSTATALRRIDQLSNSLHYDIGAHQ